MRGNMPDMTVFKYANAAHSSNDVKISCADWQALVPHAYIWLDYISVSRLVRTTRHDTRHRHKYQNKPCPSKMVGASTYWDIF